MLDPEARLHPYPPARCAGGKISHPTPLSHRQLGVPEVRDPTPCSHYYYYYTAVHGPRYAPEMETLGFIYSCGSGGVETLGAPPLVGMNPTMDIFMGELCWFYSATHWPN